MEDERSSSRGERGDDWEERGSDFRSIVTAVHLLKERGHGEQNGRGRKGVGWKFQLGEIRETIEQRMQVTERDAP